MHPRDKTESQPALPRKIVGGTRRDDLEPGIGSQRLVGGADGFELPGDLMNGQ
jgi:hypothetical protein